MIGAATHPSPVKASYTSNDLQAAALALTEVLTEEVSQPVLHHSNDNNSTPGSENSIHVSASLAEIQSSVIPSMTLPSSNKPKTTQHQQQQQPNKPSSLKPQNNKPKRKIHNALSPQVSF